MSWDVVILNEATADQGRPADQQSQPLGTADDVRAAISKVWPAVGWSDATWGSVETEDWSIEFNLGDRPVLDSIMLHVRGEGDPALAIHALCRVNGWIARDAASSELLDRDDPAPSTWNAFRGFRDRLHGLVPPADPGMTLAKSQLRVDATTLVNFTDTKVVATHNLSDVKHVQFGRIVNLAPLAWAGICLAIGIFLKLRITSNWVGWLCLLPFVMLAVLFVASTIYSAINDTLSFDVNGRRWMYPLVDAPAEVDAFRTYLLDVLQQQETKPRG